MNLNEFISTQQSALVKKEETSEVLQRGGKEQKQVLLQGSKEEAAIPISPSEYDNEFGEDMIVPSVNQTEVNVMKENKATEGKKMSKLNRKNAIIMQDQDINDQEKSKNKGEKQVQNEKTLKYSKQVQINKLRVSIKERRQLSNSSPESERIKEMQEKIKLIAKTIRQKVKKDGDKEANYIHRQKKNRLLQLKQLKKIENRSIALSPLSKQPISSEYINENPSTLITSLQHQLKTFDPKLMVKEIIKNDILGSMWKAIQLQQKMNKYKLKLDPIKHRYPLTSFRKVILEQCKQSSKEEENKLKERQEKLMKRKMIYNSSRFDRYIKQQKGKQSLSRNIQTKFHQNQQISGVTLDQITPRDEQHLQNPEMNKVEDKKIVQLMPNQSGKEEIVNQERKQDYLQTKQAEQVKQAKQESEDQEYYF